MLTLRLNLSSLSRLFWTPCREYSYENPRTCKEVLDMFTLTYTNLATTMLCACVQVCMCACGWVSPCLCAGVGCVEVNTPVCECLCSCSGSLCVSVTLINECSAISRMCAHVRARALALVASAVSATCHVTDNVPATRRFSELLVALAD